jgi:hypothetical protein
VTYQRTPRTAILALAVLIGGQTVWGQRSQPNQPARAESVDEPAASRPQPQGPPPVGPTFLNLRYDEDFSYLDGAPESYTADVFDPIKNAHLAEHWRLTLGGEFRYRLEAETNQAFGATEPAQDTFHLFRYTLHADMKYRDSFRVFVQGLSAFDEDRDLAPRGSDENKGDLQQLFFDLRVRGDDLPLTLRLGRQELQYGAERFVSPFDWADVRRRFDGIKLFVHGDAWNVDLWYAKPVVVQAKRRDRLDEDYDFYGCYVTYKQIPRHVLDVYILAQHNTGNPTNVNGRAGDFTRYTLGSRFRGKTAGFDYETEWAGQWGHWARDSIQAWAWAVDGGYTFDEASWSPRVGLGFDWATGDDDPADGTVGTFDQLFPLGHQYLGFLDLVGRQNVAAVNVSLTARPIAKKVTSRLAFYSFWLSENEDALYNAGGAAVRRDPSGRSGHDVGHELDWTIVWTIDVHQSVLFGYSHFWDGGFIQETSFSENADLLYVQYAYKF